jgi:hypothetical protein
VLRWSTSPKNPLWGNITNSPNVVTPNNKHRSHRWSIGYPTLNKKMNNNQEQHASSIDRGVLVPSLSKCDQSNLSPTMQKALRVVHMHTASYSAECDLRSTRASDHLGIDVSGIAETSPGATRYTSRWLDALERNDSDGNENIDNCMRAPIYPSVKSGSALSTETRSSRLESILSYSRHWLPTTPSCLDGEFVTMKDTLDPSGGVRVKTCYSI